MRINYKAIEKDPRAYAEKLRVPELVSTLKLFDHYYHDKNAEKISDNKYDIMKDVLEERSPNNKYLKDVGSAVSKGKKKVKLLEPMPSLDKLKPGRPALYSYLDPALYYIVADKLDGISLQLVYEKGRLVQATTRGKGLFGQDVSAVIPALNCPKRIPEKQTVSVRAELAIKKKVFRQYDKKHGGDFATDRNMGGGLLNRNEPPAELKSFDVVAYEVMHGPLKGKPFSKQLLWLKNQKFTVVKYKRVKGLTEEKLIRLLEQRRKKALYPIDGIVVSKDKSYRRVTTTDKPSYQKAFKINSDEDSREATVVEVEWNVSRNGILAPRIIIEPIMLGGVKVTHFTAHNMYYIKHGWAFKDRAKYAGQKKRPIGPGAKLKVIRSGDVIPFIQEVLKPARKPQLPDIEYKVDKHGKKAVALEDSSDRKIKAITFFFSTIKAEGVKSATVKLMYEAGYDSIKAILDMTVEDIAELPRFTVSSATKLRNNIDTALNDLTFAQIGTASGVFKNMGEKKLDAVYEAYPEIMNMVKLPHAELVEKIKSVKGFAQTSETIASGLPKFVRFVKRHNLKMKAPKTIVAESNKLNGKSYLLTGVRDPAVVDFIRSNGGTIASSVKSAKVLIIKEEGYENKKTETARELGVIVVPVAKFKRKYKIG